jgi:outer membrane lipoprotein-sorting protein
MRRTVVAAIAVWAAVGAAASALADESRALLDRVRELQQTTRKWTDRTQRLALTVVDRRGGEHHRDLEVMTKKYGDDASRSIMFFHSPPMVRGIGFLQWIAPKETDRQWLYLPSSKRVRQISGGSRTESFAGTDFSYEDLAIMGEVLDWTETEARSTLAGEEQVNGQPCAIIELRPTPAAEVNYGLLRLWVGRDDHLVHRYQFVDPDGQVAKTLVLSDIREVNGIPAAHHMDMRNDRAGSHTAVEVSSLQYNSGLDDDLFTQRRLEKGL